MENIICVSQSKNGYAGRCIELTISIADFSNVLTKMAIERLAEADEYEVVREVQVGQYLNTSWLQPVSCRPSFRNILPITLQFSHRCSP